MRHIKFRAWDEKYEVGDNGSIYSLNYNNSWERREMKQYLTRDWYYHIYLTERGKRTKKLVHRMVALLFLENPENKKEVNHKNWVRIDNNIDNLEWNTHQENVIHSWKVNGRKFSEKAREVARQKMIKINLKKYANT